MFISCDPTFKAFDFKNNTNDSIYVGYYFIQDTIIHLIAFSGRERVIPPHKDEKFYKSLTPLEESFKWAKEKLKDTTLEVVTFDYKDAPDTSLNLNKLFDLFLFGKYMINSYTYEELKSKNFKIIFPDDGFEEGRPIKLYLSSEVLE